MSVSWAGAAGAAAASASAADAAVGRGSVMALETLSPDWEFDRVDDGSQSKGGKGGRQAARCACPSQGGTGEGGC